MFHGLEHFSRLICNLRITNKRKNPQHFFIYTDKSKKTIVAIAVPISVAIVAFVVIFCIAMRKRKTYNAIAEISGDLI